jgi:WD40 repeat protein
MPRTRICPEVSQYQRLAAGQLADADKEALLAHLEGCDGCARRIAALPETDPLASLLRHADTLDEASGQTIARLVERLSKLRPAEPPAGESRTLPPREQDEAPRLTFACPACGKRVKVKVILVGKNVRCPHCRQAVRVPVPSTGTKERTNSPTGAPAVSRGVSTASNHAAAPASKELYDFLSPPQAPDELGRLGPYRVLQVLGAGGMGVVFRAEDPQLKRLVALKAMLPALAVSATARQRFLREAQAAAAIKHDHIVTIYQVGEDSGVPFLAMEFLEGEPLDARLEREGKLPPAEVVRIGREIALGLAAAHKRELIHRDIKPANVWLEAETGRVKILDFGLARGSGADGQLTQPGAIVGTPAYMAPEQANSQSVDARCDLFSLGCVLYRMATGEPPFKGTDMISLLMAVATENPRPPQELEPGLPPALSDLILRLLAKEPGGRPPSAQVVAEALEHALGPGPERPVGARSVSDGHGGPVAHAPGSDIPPARSRWRVMAGAAACVLLVVLIGLWASGIFRVKTRDGVLVVEVNEPNADVYVDGEQVTVTWGDGGKKAEIHVKPGTKRVEVKKDGFSAHGEEVALEDGGRRLIAARLEPTPGRPASPSEVSPPPEAAGGFVPLFNGKDLTGWFVEGADPVGTANRWKVADGEISTSSEGFRTHSNLLSVREYANFRLRLEYNLPVGGNCGVALRAFKGEIMRAVRGERLFDHPSVQIENRGSAETGATHWVLNTSPVAPSRPAQLQPAGSWNRLEIEVNGRSLRAWVNGVQTVNMALDAGARLADGSIPALNRPQGRIGLESHTGTVRFRNLAIKDLPAEELAPARPKPGKVFGAWVPEKDRGKWCVVDGCLEQTTLTDRVWIYFGDTSWRDYDYSLEFLRVQGEESLLMAFRTDWENSLTVHPRRACVFGVNMFRNSTYAVTSWVESWKQGAGHEYANKKGSIPANTWMRARVSVRGARAQCFLNDQKQFDVKLDPPHGAGCVGLMAFESHFRFRNIRVTDPEGKVLLEGLPDLESIWRPSADAGEKKAAAPAPGSPAVPAPADALRRQQIPPGELAAVGGGDPAKAPAALVAVLGDSHLKHWAEVLRLSYSGDGKLLATGSADGTACLWEAATGKLLRSLEASAEGAVRSVALSGNGKLLATGGDDKTVRLWETATGRLLWTSGPQADNVAAVAFSPDGRFLAVATDLAFGRLVVWEVASRRPHWTFKVTADRVWCVAFSPDGKTLAAGGGRWSDPAAGRGWLWLWELETGKERHALTGHGEPVEGLAFSRDGTLLASASWDRTVKLWNPATGEEVRTLSGHGGHVHGVAFSPDGKAVASASHDATVKLWDVADGKLRATLADGTLNHIYSVAFSPDGRALAAGCWNQRAPLWDPATGRELPASTGHGRAFSWDYLALHLVAISPDGATLACGGPDPQVRLWDLATGRPKGTLPGSFRVLAFSPDNRVLAAGSIDKTIRLWDVATGQAGKTLRGHAWEISSLAFSPDGQVLASGSGDHTVKLWDVTRGESWLRLEGHTAAVRALAFSKDGMLLASGSEDKSIKVWDVAKGQLRATLTGHRSVVHFLAFAADGRTLYSAAHDGTIRLWDLETGQARVTLDVPTAAVALSPDGQTLAGVGRDGTVRLRDAATGRPREVIRVGPRGWIAQLVFTPDSRHLVTANGNGTLYVLRLPGR